MPPPGYNPEARYLRAIRQVPDSTGINAINRRQSAELDQYETEDTEDDSDEADDLDHFLNESQEAPDNDPWLKKWVIGHLAKRYEPIWRSFNFLTLLRSEFLSQ